MLVAHPILIDPICPENKEKVDIARKINGTSPPPRYSVWCGLAETARRCRLHTTDPFHALVNWYALAEERSSPALISLVPIRGLASTAVPGSPPNPDDQNSRWRLNATAKP